MRSPEHCTRRTQEDLDVERQRPVVDVLQVEFDTPLMKVRRLVGSINVER